MKSFCIKNIISILLCAVCAAAQTAQVKTRLRERINRDQTTVLAGHMHPLARAAYDQGPVAGSFVLPSVTLYIQPSPAQKAALAGLLASQQNPKSPLFHQWLTPEQFGDRFGATVEDYKQLRDWLAGEGFVLSPETRGRRWITFQATASQIETTFKTSIHRYQVKGESHFANATNPSIPVALTGMVASLRGLHDFRMKPLLKRTAQPRLNFSDGTHGIAPDDFSTIYDVAPLYAAGIDGTGQTIAIAGQSSVRASDQSRFRTNFNLSAQTVKQILVPGQQNPGIVEGDVDESDLDIQWAGAVARGATIDFVYSGDVQTSINYIVDQNLAPVFSSSYGICEAYDLVDLPSTQMTAQQANAQGQTWVNASGDAGAADCDLAFTDYYAQAGLAVDAPASIPEVTGVGGSQLNDVGGTYWAAKSNANSASALSYIPEVAWNTTIADQVLSAGGGGVSLIFPKPVWQSGPGVPTGGLRNTPDVSLNASDYTPVPVVGQGQTGYFYGTSLASPTFAGILVLLNQYLVSSGALKQPGLGNVNTALYRLAQTNPSVFHDITGGNNIVPCAAGSPNCVNGQMGFSAGAGYDNATGLGSVDANLFVHTWSSSTPQGSAVVPSIDQIPVFQQAPDASGNQWTFTLTLSEEAGVATTLTSMTIDGHSFDPQASFGTTAIPAGRFITSNVLGLAQVAVPKTVLFTFAGKDGSGKTWTQDFSIPFQGLQVKQTVTGAGNAASGSQTYAPGMLVSVYGTNFGEFAQAAGAIPLPNLMAGFEAYVDGVPAPLYYVSPGQVNIQIPYETSIGGQSMLVTGNPYDDATFTIPISASAPGIFASNGVTVPFASAQRGSTTTIFITGEGLVNDPNLQDGYTPDPSTPVNQLPKPLLRASMTVGGQSATIAFIGIPSGLVGVTQVNFVVPATTPLGSQPVVVTIGTASSPPVNITVTQ
jgi:uncharacterized protein (TIGR03437 family)